MPTLISSARPGTPLGVFLKALGVRTADLAARCQIHPSYASSIVTGQRRPSRRLRRAISEALSVPESSLWPEQEAHTS